MSWILVVHREMYCLFSLAIQSFDGSHSSISVSLVHSWLESHQTLLAWKQHYHGNHCHEDRMVVGDHSLVLHWHCHHPLPLQNTNQDEEEDQEQVHPHHIFVSILEGNHPCRFLAAYLWQRLEWLPQWPSCPPPLKTKRSGILSDWIHGYNVQQSAHWDDHEWTIYKCEWTQSLASLLVSLPSPYTTTWRTWFLCPLLSLSGS